MTTSIKIFVDKSEWHIEDNSMKIKVSQKKKDETKVDELSSTVKRK